MPTMPIVCHVGTFHKCDNRDKLDSMLKIIWTKLFTKKVRTILLKKKSENQIESELKIVFSH